MKSATIIKIPNSISANPTTKSNTAAPSVREVPHASRNIVADAMIIAPAIDRMVLPVRGDGPCRHCSMGRGQKRKNDSSRVVEMTARLLKKPHSDSIKSWPLVAFVLH